MVKFLLLNSLLIPICGKNILPYNYYPLVLNLIINITHTSHEDLTKPSQTT